jgi:hypothetical protein
MFPKLCIFLQLAIVVACVRISAMGPKGGIRKRLAEHTEDSKDSVESEGIAPRGGIRQRVSEVLSQSASSTDVAPNSDAVAVVVASGGVRQRLSKHVVGESHRDESKDLPLLRSLKRDWALGVISSQKVQEYAMGASTQGAVGMHGVASAGSFGKHSGNVFNSLVAAFGMPIGAPEFFWVEIPVQGESRPQPHPFILPHRLFATLFQHRNQIWESEIRGPNELLDFWRHNEEIIRLHGHLDRKHLRKTIPIGLHGDAGAFTKNESILTISWNSLTGKAKACTLAKRFVFTTIKASSCKPDGSTLDAIWKIFAWSVDVLLSGMSPSTDFRGRPVFDDVKPLAEGYRAAFCQCRGDWAFFSEALGFPWHNEVENMCWLCNAGARDPRCSWTDFTPDAGWRATRRTHESYCGHLERIGKPISALFQATGFRLEFVMIDVLHTVDLGIASHIIGNVMLEIMQTKIWGTNRPEQVKGLMAHMNVWYKTHVLKKSRLQGKLTVDRIKTSKGWPKLKAKAAATRHLSRYALELSQTYNSGSLHDQLRLAVCQLLVRFYDILECEDMFLSEQSKAELPKLSLQLCNIYDRLAKEAIAANRRAWKLAPKFHLFLHLCEWQAIRYGNPRFWWCYPDEDLVGHMIEVARSTHPKTMAAVSLFKWLVFFFDDLLGIEQE